MLMAACTTSWVTTLVPRAPSYMRMWAAVGLRFSLPSAPMCRTSKVWVTPWAAAYSSSRMYPSRWLCRRAAERIDSASEYTETRTNRRLPEWRVLTRNDFSRATKFSFPRMDSTGEGRCVDCRHDLHFHPSAHVEESRRDRQVFQCRDQGRHHSPGRAAEPRPPHRSDPRLHRVEQGGHPRFARPGGR